MTTICIAGGRDCELTEEGVEALLHVLTTRYFHEELRIIEGGASGIDAEVDKKLNNFFVLADSEDWEIERETFFADWKTYGKKAGYLRNDTMAQQADVGILFPGGRGTDLMCQCLQSHNKKVIDFRDKLSFVKKVK